MHRKNAFKSLLWLAGVPFCAHALPAIGTPAASAVLSAGAYQVTATSQISVRAGDPALISGGVNLLRVDGAAPSILGVMHDDGLNGDSVAGDGIYTFVFTASAASIGQMQLQVSAGFRGLVRRLLSNTGTAHTGPAITQVAPNSGLPGQQGEGVNITGLGTHWVQGTTTASFGAGVTVATLTVNSATSATAVLNISSGAVLGANNVTFTTGSEVVILTNGFSIEGTPALTLVSPNAGQQGQQSEIVNLTGQFTHWAQDTTTAAFAGGDIDGYIVPGVADLWLAAQPAGTVLGDGDGAPVNSPILAWTGLNRPAGSYLTFSVTGTTNYGGCQSNSPDGDGCELFTTAGFFGISTFTGPSNALIGVFVNASTPNSTAPDGLDFTAPGAITQPVISPLLNQVFFIGDGLTGTGTGSIQQFVIPAGATQLYLASSDTIGENYNNSGIFAVVVTDLSGGITVTSLTVNSATSATATVNIDPGAVIAANYVTVTTGAEVVAKNNSFTVTAGTPVLTPANPNNTQQGQQSISVTLTGEFTHWVQDTTTASFGAGVTVATLTVNLWNSATAVLNIDPAAALGARNVTVTTGMEVVALNGGFTVTAGTPVLTLVNPGTGNQGQQSEFVTVTGQYTHWVQGTTTASFGPNIAVVALTINSATSATAALNISSAAAIGAYDVTFTTGAEVAILSGGFTVFPGAPIPTLVSPNTGQQGQQSESVIVTGQFTTWTQGVTTASFGAGVTVATLTINSATSATAVLNIAPSAAIGANSVIFTTGAEVDTLMNGFTVTAGTPVLTLLNPNSGQQGQQSESVSVTGQYTHWEQGTTTASFGTGVTVAALTVNSATSATAVLNIAPSAAIGATNVTFTTGVEVTTLTNAFTVNVPSPEVTVVNPNSGLQAQLGESVSVTGRLTHWAQGTTTASFGAGITVATLTINSATTATAVLNISPAAAIGANNVTLTTGAEVATLNNGFTVNVGAPVLTLANPNSGQQGQQAETVNLTGQFTHWTLGVTTASFGAGITAATLDVNSPTAATAVLNIDPAATAGTRSITVTTGSEAVSLLNGFTVSAVIPSPAITSALPGSGLKGQAVQVTITGQNTHFQQGVTTANFGPGVSIGGSIAGTRGLVTVTSSTTATASLTVPASAATGSRTIQVQTGTEEASLINGFVVKGPPYLSSISPNSGNPGDTLSATIHGTYTSFQQGVTTATFGAGISVGGGPSGAAGPVTVSDSGDATAQLIIDPAAAPGLRNPVVQTGAEQASLTNSGFTVLGPVTGPAPVAVIASPMEADQVTTLATVTGSVDSPNLSNWILEYQASGSTVFTQFGSGATTAVSAVFDPSLLLNGIAQLRLTATDLSGQTGVAITNVVVAGRAKVGNFSVSFNDLTIPVAGIPIEIIRTYDTRNKASGDFGFGWSLAIQTSKVQTNGLLGDNWQGIKQGTGAFGSYCVQAASNHVVTLVIEGGDTYTFQPTFTQPCSQIVGPQFVNMIFTPTGLTPPNATLQVPDGAGLMVFGDFPGDIYLADPNTFETYDPDQFILTLPNGVQIQISQSFGVQDMVDRNNNALTFTAAGILSSNGPGVAFARDGQNRITSITDPSGNVINYTYSDTGDLTGVQDSLNHVSTFSYDAFHDLVSYVDGSGHQPIRNVYDDSGRLIQVIDAFGHVTNLSHDPGASTETVTDALGNSTTLVYDANGNILSNTDALGHITSATFDSGNNVLTATDALGHTTTFSYDSNNNQLTLADSLGHTVTRTFDSNNNALTVQDPNGNVTTNAFDLNGNLLTRTDAAGNVTTYTYASNGNQSSVTDALGHAAQYGYDNQGRLTNIMDPAGITTTYTFDGNGNRISETVTRTTPAGPQVQTTNYQYDANNRVILMTAPDGTTTGQTYNANGQVASSVDSSGRATLFAYDDAGRLIETTYPDGTRQSTIYDAAGQRVQTTDPSGATTTFTYDAAGRMLTVTNLATGAVIGTVYDAAGNKLSETDPLGHTTQFTYDASNRETTITDALHHVTSFAYDAAGNQTGITDAKGNTITQQYNANNKAVKKIYADNTFEQVSYDASGKAISKTDTAGKTTQFTYDSKGRLLTVTDALGHVTSYGYDEVNDRTSQTDANGHATTFAYDSLHRRIGRTLPGGQSESYTYSAVGDLASYTDFNGKVTTYTYDSLHRPLSKTPDPSFASPAVTYTYTTGGQRASMTDVSGVTTYTYDSSNRLILTAKPNGRLAYTYDLADNETSVTTGGGTSVTYTYDALNRLATVTDTGGGTGITTYSYDQVGNVAGFSYPNGIAHAFTYNNRNQLTALSAGKGASAVVSYNYTLDPTGRRLSISELSGRVAAYGYDSVYRLTSETVSGAPSGPNGVVSYNYDPVGNRLQTTSTLAGVSAGSFTYDADDHLASDTYDANGNTISSAGAASAYDFENHLTQYGSVTIAYDGDGNRVSKTAGGVTAKYLVDDKSPSGLPQVIEESASDGSARKLVYGLQRLSQKYAAPSINLTSFFVYDGQGSVRALTDANGSVTDTYDYDAFGNTLHKTGATPNEFLYAGEAFDTDLGLYYNRARYMKPSTGRFYSMDTVDGDPQTPLSLHKYLYANGDPVNAVDPTGHDADLGSVMADIAVQDQLTSVVMSALAPRLLAGGAAGIFIAATIPPGFFDEIKSKPLTFDGALAGVSGSVSASGGAPVGLTAVAGLDFLIGRTNHNWAIYAYEGGGGTFGSTGFGASVSLSAGAVWRTPDTSAYEGDFNTLSVPASALGQYIANMQTAALSAANQLTQKFVRIGYNNVTSGVGKVLTSNLYRISNYFAKGLSSSATINLFYSPDDVTGGSMGFSVSIPVAGTANSTSNISLTRTTFVQEFSGGNLF